MISGYPILTEARAALDDGRHELATRLLTSHLRVRPGEPRGLALLGAVAMKAGALHQSENFLRQSLARGGDSEEVWRDLAACLNQQERPDEALQIFNRLDSPKARDPELVSSLAFTLDKLGRSDEARQNWEWLVEQFSDRPAYWISYGLNLRAEGLTDEAIQAFRKAVAIERERGEAWWGLASIKTYTFSKDDIKLMEAALGTASDLLNLAPLHFALGRARHLRQDYEKAFHHFSEANRFWAEALNYNADELTQEVSQAQEVFDPDYFKRLPAGGDQSDAPIFIVSLPRSGSTLLEQMLGCHQDVEPLGELSYVPALLRGVMERATQRGRTTVPQAVAQLSPSERTQLGEEYLRRAALHRATNSSRFTDKLPHNWNNTIFIRHILPNAKIIDIRRDAISCCFANFSHSFTRAHASSFTLRDIGRAYVDYVRLMNHIDEAAPGLIHHVRYERLVENPEVELRAVLAYLGLEWDPALLRFYESRRTVRTPSSEQVRRPLNREGMGAWKPYAEWLGPLRAALGPLGAPVTEEFIHESP
jgi:tetratricopeptide (TPR) repeat protein